MRIEKLRAQLEKAGLSAALIATEQNVRYYSGFRGDSTQLLITAGGKVLFTDFRYTEQAENETDFEVVETGGAGRAEAICARAGGGRIGIDLAELPVGEYRAYLQHVGEQDVHDISAAVSAQRMIKDAGETALLAQGSKMCDELFAHLCRVLKPGISEMDVKAEIVYYMNRHGAESAFDPIAASGENGSLPHAKPGARKLLPGDFLTMDFGCRIDGYCSDFTRTVAISTVDKEQQKVYDIVNTAGHRALSALAPGQRACDVDAAARGYIADMGYGQAFGHGLGHSVGLAVHEAPSLNARTQDVLAPGMAVTIEPGIYLKGRFGVRIEDLCVLTEDGFKNLNSAPRDLIII